MNLRSTSKAQKFYSVSLTRVQSRILPCSSAPPAISAEKGIKPSSLEYKSLPSSYFSLNSFAASFSILLKITTDIPDYPYVSSLDLALTHVPDLHFRVQPSLIPVLSGWIQSSVSSGLSDYLEPNFIGIDIPAWLSKCPRFLPCLSCAIATAQTPLLH